MGAPFRKPSILAGPYFFDHEDNRMRNEGNVAHAREHFEKEKPYALEYLLHTRYDWMKEFIKDGDRIVEFGAGAAFSKVFLHYEGLVVTDVVDYPWIDETVDAMNPPYESESIDIILCSNMIHHLAKPVEFLRTAERLLKPGGHILILKPYPSFMMRSVLYFMRHEGFSYEKDPFDPNEIITNPKDPWSANNAVSKLVFEDRERFRKEFPSLDLVTFRPNEFFTFLFSGGVTSKTLCPPIPKFIRPVFQAIDQFLTWLAPGIFALSCRIHVQKKANPESQD